jgi:hypothetical protein
MMLFEDRHFEWDQNQKICRQTLRDGFVVSRISKTITLNSLETKTVQADLEGQARNQTSFLNYVLWIRKAESTLHQGSA